MREDDVGPRRNAGPDRNRLLPVVPEQFARQGGSEFRVAMRRKDRSDGQPARYERPYDGECIVDVVADIGVDDDLRPAIEEIEKTGYSLDHHRRASLPDQGTGRYSVIPGWGLREVSAREGAPSSRSRSADPSRPAHTSSADHRRL